MSRYSFGELLSSLAPLVLLCILQTSCGATQRFEAEDNVVGPMAVYSDLAETGTQYAAVKFQSLCNISRPVVDGTQAGSTFGTFTVANANIMQLRARVKTHSPLANSFFVQVDTGVPQEWNLGIYPAWTEVSVLPAPYNLLCLSAGAHSIHFTYREVDTQIDYFSISDMFPAPVIVATKGCAETGTNYTSDCPTEGAALSIIGMNFGPVCALDVTVNAVPCPVLTSKPYIGIEFDDDELVEVVCTLPPGSGIANTVSLSVNDIADTAVISYKAPRIISVGGCGPSNEDCPISAVTLTITGTNFGNDASVVAISLGGRTCGSVAFTTPHTVLTCVLSAGENYGLPLSFVVDGRGAANHVTLGSKFGCQLHGCGSGVCERATGECDCIGDYVGEKCDEFEVGPKTTAAIIISCLVVIVCMFAIVIGALLWKRRRAMVYVLEQKDEENELQMKELELREKELERLKRKIDDFTTGSTRSDSTIGHVDVSFSAVIGTLKRLESSLSSEGKAQDAEALATVLKVIQEGNLFQATPANVNDSQTRDWLESEMITVPEQRSSNAMERTKQTDESSRKLSPRFLSEAATELLGRVDQWDFDIFKLSEVCDNPLMALTMSVLDRHNLFTALGVNKTKLRNFLIRIEEGYRKNFYHNACHAADVVQNMHFLLTRGLHAKLSELELFACFMAAAIHDFEHPGVNNNFLIKSKDALALRYNDRSILENHHVSAACLVAAELDPFEGMSEKQATELRSLMISLVLATDMARHFELTSMFSALVARYVDREDDSAEDDSADLVLMMEMTLKLADVSNPAKPGPLSRKWTENIMEEFFSQGDNERASEMVVSPFMNRQQDSIAKVQVGFISFVVSPTWKAYHQLFQVDETIECMEANLKHWQEVDSREKERTARNA